MPYRRKTKQNKNSKVVLVGHVSIILPIFFTRIPPICKKIFFFFVMLEGKTQMMILAHQRTRRS